VRLIRPVAVWRGAGLSLLLMVLAGFALQDRSWNLWGPSFLRGVAVGVFDLTRPAEAYTPGLREIRNLGANSISLPVYWLQKDVEASAIAPREEIPLAMYDDIIRSLIAKARDLGMEVLLMPVVQLGTVQAGEWRGTIRPEDEQSWWSSYTRFIMHYAHMAADEGVELFCVGSELSSMQANEWEWRNLIADVRQVYEGRLIYSANWDQYRDVGFWDEVDFLGLSGYYTLSRQLRPEYGELAARWERIRDELSAWSRSQDRKLLFTEVGYASRSNAALSPWDYTTGAYPDLRLQQLCYRAFVDTWRDSAELAGTYMWIWELGKGGTGDGGYSWRGKPSERVINEWYRSI
jgi:hypothetical protein